MQAVGSQDFTVRLSGPSPTWARSGRTLDRHDEEILETFGRHLTELPEVLEAYLTTGDYDYLIKVAVEGTSGYERFLRERLYRIPGIRHSRTSFALRCLKRMHSDQV